MHGVAGLFDRHPPRLGLVLGGPAEGQGCGQQPGGRQGAVEVAAFLAAPGQQPSMTMHHYWRIRDGKIERFRGSEDTAQTARILTADLAPAPHP